MNYDTAYTRSFASTSSTGGLKYGQHRSMFDSSDGFSANSYSRPSQPPDFFQYMRTGNPNMAPPLDYRNSAPLNLTPSAFPAQSQVTPFLPSREVNPREVNPDPGDPSFHQQFEGANCHRNPMDYQRRPRPDYVRSGEYGGRADRSGPPQMREGRYGGRGDRPVMGYGSREERREEHSRERSSSRRAEKRPREDGGDESEQMREIDRERGDDRNLRRSSSVRPIPVISARSETGSTMDRYGFAEGSASQRTVYGGRGDRISFHPPPSLGPPPSKHQRTFPSKSAVGKDKADRRRKGRAPGRNPFNLGDTSDEDELTMHIVPVPGHFARTPSRSPEPASTAATAASGRATPAVSALSVSPSNRPPTLRPPPESHPACVDVVDVSSDDEEKRQERRKAAKILYDARTHVSTVVDGLGKLRPLPSLTGRFYESVYTTMTSSSPSSSDSAPRRVTVAPSRSRGAPTHKTTTVAAPLPDTVAGEGTVLPPSPGGADEYEEDTVAAGQREDTVEMREDSVHDEETGPASMNDSYQPMNSSTSSFSTPSHDYPSPCRSPERGFHRVWQRGCNCEEDFEMRSRFKEVERKAMNLRLFPTTLPKPHPGIQGSKLIVDLMSGEAVVEGQGGRKTGFTTLRSISLFPRGGVASNVLFSIKELTKVEINGQTRMYGANLDEDLKDCCMTNAVIDSLNCDRKRIDRFNEWTENGDIVMQSEMMRHRMAGREDWMEKQERKRREEKEEWGEWEEKKMEEEERKREERRREDMDRECFDEWVETLKKKTGEEERAKALREMAANLMKMAESTDEGRRQKEERARERREERRREQDEKERRRVMEEEETTVERGRSTVDEEMEEEREEEEQQPETNQSMEERMEKEGEQEKEKAQSGKKTKDALKDTVV